MHITIKLTIPYFYYNELLIDLEQFMTGVFLEFESFLDENTTPYLTLCFNTGWFLQPVVFHIGTAQKFYDCYKIVLKSLCDFSNWESPVKILDKCAFSDDELLDIYDYTYTHSS